MTDVERDCVADVLNVASGNAIVARYSDTVLGGVVNVVIDEVVDDWQLAQVRVDGADVG